MEKLEAKVKCVKVCNVTRNAVLGEKVRLAESLAARAIGLLATPSLQPGEGLWLKPCTSVHSFFMRYPIDIVFLDADHTVLSCQTLTPWRFSRWFSKSRSVIELPAGTVQRSVTSAGDRIEFMGVN